MSNVVEGVEVIEFSRKCFNVSTQKHFWVVIKRLSLADLAFQVAVATAWCKTPKLVLEYKKPTPAEARATAAAEEPEHGGVRGERQQEKRARAAASTTPAPREPSARSKSPANQRSPKMTPQKLDKAKESYQQSPGLHQLLFPKLTAGGNVPDCQLCQAGFGERKPGLRFQTPCMMLCKECNLHICGPGCWQKLHGYYAGGETLESVESSIGASHLHQLGRERQGCKWTLP